MQGLTLLFIVVPIVLPAAMFGWLGLVFWAAAHPEWKSHRAAASPAAPGPAVTARAASELPAPAPVARQRHAA